MNLRHSHAATRRGALFGAAAMLGLALKPSSGRAAARPVKATRRPALLMAPEDVRAMATALAQAPSHGFSRSEFWSGDVSQADFATPEAQAHLRAAILAYARAQRGQRLAPEQFLADWSVRPAPYDPAPGLAQALASGGVQAWLDSLPPRYEGYESLRRSLVRYRALAQAGGWGTVAFGDPLNLGVKDPRVAAVRQRLSVTDAVLAGTVPADPETFDADLQAAVQRYQARMGLTPDGEVGEPTLTALNISAAERVLQIEANMERWRWLPRELPATRIQVNIAAAVLAAYRDGEPVMAMKAVAGRPADQTPMLHSSISSIVLNPPWHVPGDIARKELWPKAKANPAYLAKNDYRVVHGQLVQQAGPKSALGRFKFDFSNPFGVYLHDTPAQAGFGRSMRLASHGCVRLEQPEALADLLLQGNAAWPPARIAQAVTTPDTIRIGLAQGVPVYILYWTAFADNEGATQFRADAYDWDRELIQRLNAAKGRGETA